MIAPLPVVVFAHGSMMFGLEAHRVAGRGRVAQNSTSVVPFSLLYSLRHDNEPPVDDTVTEWLRLRGRAADWLLGISKSADLIELAPEQIYPLPELLVQGSKFDPLKALGFYQQQLIALLDVDQLTLLAGLEGFDQD